MIKLTLNESFFFDILYCQSQPQLNRNNFDFGDIAVILG